MRIQVTRSGGFLGAPRASVLETEGRPDAPHIHALAREALGACTRTPTFGVPDGFHYTISVDGRSPVHCAEPQLTDSQSDLIALVLAQGD
ncbi:MULTISPECIES: protealysin inhibitor emfourin [Streptacidiphilus]|uniref:Protealysin inhibitor emfourin n=1 Tax=Streptacidiphilus cavernicola TaxID=3342716 RepID=A0ABV6UF76_9ACTN|nr:protealysin inhibitor emfourin [Streptacidiphilus jeojiense]